MVVIFKRYLREEVFDRSLLEVADVIKFEVENRFIGATAITTAP